MKYIKDPVKMKILLSKCPLLEAKLANLKINLQVAYKQGTSIIAEPEEIMEAMALLNIINGMPRVASIPGDKMNNIVDGYQKILDTEFDELCQGINNEIFVIDSVVRRINNGISKLSEKQKTIIILKYWKMRFWKQIQDTTRFSEKQVKEYHKKGIERLCKAAEIDAESYEFCMERIV